MDAHDVTQVGVEALAVSSLVGIVSMIAGDKPPGWFDRIKPAFCLVFGIVVSFLTTASAPWQQSVLKGIAIGFGAAGAYRTGNVVIRGK